MIWFYTRTFDIDKSYFPNIMEQKYNNTAASGGLILAPPKYERPTRQLPAKRVKREEILLRKNYAYLILGAVGVAVAASAGPVAADAQETVKYQVVNGNSIPASLTGKTGDPAKGREVAINRRQGNCLACHAMPISEQPYHGGIGPDLNGIGSRYSAGELRLRIVNPKIVNPDTIMPAFYRADGLHRVLKDFQGKTVLTAEQVEDVVAYLTTLK